MQKELSLTTVVVAMLIALTFNSPATLALTQEKDQTQEKAEKREDQQSEKSENESEKDQDSKKSASEQEEEKADDSDKQESEEKDQKKDKSEEKEDSNEDEPGTEGEEKPDANGDAPMSLEEVKERINRIRGGAGQPRYSKMSESFVKVFDPVISSVNDATIQIVSGKKRQIALGTVVDSNGFILTKASELVGDIGCKLPDGKVVKAKVFGVDDESDLALLKIEAGNLSEAPWGDDALPNTGQWLASPKAIRSGNAVIGVVSVASRDIPPSRPFIGIQMTDYSEDDVEGVLITVVIPGSPARSAGIKKDDIIYQIDDSDIKDSQGLRDSLQNYDVGDFVTLGVVRNKKEIQLNLQLAKRDEVSPEFSRSNTQNAMGSTLSKRRKNFPLAFQHDSNLTRNTCGGPIVDLSGKIVGINIARAGRVSSLAIPVSAVREVIAELKTGEKAPHIVNKEEIKKVEARLVKVIESVGNLPEKKDVLEQRYSVERARAEELRKTMADLKKRLAVVEEREKERKEELGDVRDKLFRYQRMKRKLESEKKQLTTGVR